ncbi:MAG: cytochrome c3 family protein [Myxococcales bacterium]|nr:cytochrome c3 family protein [Myxococcales bacterium]
MTRATRNTIDLRMRLLAPLLLVLSLMVAAGAAIAQPDPASRAPAPAPSAKSGTTPLPNDAPVPLKWLPPGAFDPDTGPSDVVFPAQQMTLRFNHKKHQGFGLKCQGCHTKATTSQRAEDDLVPDGRTCDQCHGTSHADLAQVKAGEDETGQCVFCHLGAKDGARIVPFKIPPPNLVFDHKKHADRNVGCQQCHGEVGELELATRDQLPRMRGCFGGHQMPDAARGDAKAACDTCHLREATPTTGQLLPERRGVATGGRIKTKFAEGQLKPPRWMQNAGHGPDFLARHKRVAASNSERCANCHKEDVCTGCHDGRVRPRSIHPNDYLQMHPVEARMATQRCTSCHREQSFCLSCHQRLGVSMSGPAGVRESGRFHPPKYVWSDAPRKPGHHSQEAMRNLNACVSCHVERDCLVCHGGRGVGGGFNPHGTGFASSCKTQYKRNPRPCLVCHIPGSQELSSCR